MSVDRTDAGFDLGPEADMFRQINGAAADSSIFYSVLA
jgi:hypothetical protein